MDVHESVVAAHERIAGAVRHTPLEPSPWLSEAGACRAFLKLENQQRTGSFKFRGAMNRLLAMDPPARARGVVAASTGNHGAAVALGAAELGCPAVIFAPETAQPGKLAAIRSYGAAVRQVGADCVEAEAAARAHATAQGQDYVSPYNDPLVLAGQGTIAHELLRDLPDLDAVVVAVGGGGLIGGIGGYLRGARPTAQVVGASPRNSAVMHASLAAGRILDLASTPTLSDGTAGGIEPDAITFPICQEVIDRFELVTEDQIRAALRQTIAIHHTLIEGAAATAVAAFLACGTAFAGKNVAIVLCGANIDPHTLKDVL